MDTMVEERQTDTRRFILIGLGAGLAWGIAMRAWMRFISSQPEFSWSGTLFILGAATITGALLGLAWHRRAAGGVGWWRLAILSLLLLGAGGAVMWPAVVLGALALGRPWRPPIRITLGALATASQIPVVTGIADNWKFGFLRIAIATVIYIPLLAVEIWGFSVVFRPSLTSQRAPLPLRVVLITITTAAAVLAVVAAGVAGDI